MVPVRRVVNGPSHGELLERPLLKDSEPMRFNNQGTLFALTPEEVEDLADMIGESDPEDGQDSVGREPRDADVDDIPPFLCV